MMQKEGCISIFNTTSSFELIEKKKA